MVLATLVMSRSETKIPTAAYRVNPHRPELDSDECQGHLTSRNAGLTGDDGRVAGIRMRVSRNRCCAKRAVYV